jgi:hypothetical protein
MGYSDMITAVDYATKYTIAKPTRNRDAKTVAQFIFNEITCRFGSPLEIVSDRGSAFMDSTLKEYLTMLGIRHLPTTPYRPRSNGNVERMHRDLNSMLTKLCAGDTSKWPYYVSQAVLALNCRIHEVMKISPFYMVYGMDPRLPGDEDQPLAPPHIYNYRNPRDAHFMTVQRLAALGQNRGAVLARLKGQAALMKTRYDSDHAQEHVFQVGDVVKMRHHDKKKFQFNWLGPFYVVDVGFNDTYFLMKPGGARLDNPVNHDHLAYYTAADNEIYYAGTNSSIEALG